MKLKFNQINERFKFSVNNVTTLDELREVKKVISGLLDKWPKWMQKGLPPPPPRDTLGPPPRNTLG